MDGVVPGVDWRNPLRGSRGVRRSWPCLCVFVWAEDAPNWRSELAAIQVGSTQVDTRRNVIVCVCVGWLVVDC